MYVELFSKLVIHENCDPKNLTTQTSDLQMRILLNNRKNVHKGRTHTRLDLFARHSNQSAI